MSSLSLAEPFPLARYRLHGRTERRIEFSDFAGSALRGAFGHALRNSVCVTGQKTCAPCSLYRSCAYPAVFETPPPLDGRRVYSQIPNPFVIEPPPPGPFQRQPGESFEFDVVLIGPALRHLPLIALAWRRALEHGLGTSQGAVLLLRIDAEDGRTVLDLAEDRLAEHPQTLPMLPAPKALETVELEFVTPFALQRDGREVPLPALTAHDLLMALVRRVANFAEMHLGKTLDADFAALSHAATQVRGEPALRRLQWSRYSSRQQRSMPLSGGVGRWRLHGDLRPFWPFLYLGQWLHVGKKCTFGFGRYALRMPDA